MWIFLILNIAKLIIGVIIIYLTCNYINIDQDFLIWVFSMWIWAFITIWSISFFILLWIMKIISKEKTNKLTFKAYKYTWLISSYILVNFLLMSLNFWNKLIGFIILIAFLIIGLII